MESQWRFSIRQEAPDNSSSLKRDASEDVGLWEYFAFKNPQLSRHQVY